MLYPNPSDNPYTSPVSRRVRAILLTDKQRLLFIKRVKPHKPRPYWVAPGGGVEDGDATLHDTLHRELCEELGATVDILEHSFVLRHYKADKRLEEHFFVCRLRSYDLSQRHGPEFDDPTRGLYIPDEIPLSARAIQEINIRTPELRDWLLENLTRLSRL